MDELPKKKSKSGKSSRFEVFSAAVMGFIILFLVLKFLGLAKRFWGIDPYGLDVEYVWGLIATGFGLLYKEARDLRKDMDGKFDRILSKLSEQGERIAKLEATASQSRRGTTL